MGSSKKLMNGNGALEPGPRAVLIALVQAGSLGLTKAQLSVRTAYAKSTRDLYIRILKSDGLLEESGSRVYATPGGHTKLGDYVPHPLGNALRDLWYEKLPPGEGRLLMEIAAMWPGEATRELLSERAEFAKSTRDLYIRHLKRRYLITGGHDVRASDDLFDRT